MREALLTLQGLKGTGAGIAILGDMLELGKKAEELHREVGALLVEAGVAGVFLKGTLSRAVAQGAIDRGFPQKRIAFFDEPAECVDLLRSQLKAGAWILVKGSRKMNMEAVAEAIVAAFDLGRQTV
jgi:UDP-N-acetylmuramyl pentapeptide synthase